MDAIIITALLLTPIYVAIVMWLDNKALKAQVKYYKGCLQLHRDVADHWEVIKELEAQG